MSQDLQQGFPAFFRNLFQQFYSLADTIIVGRFVGVSALAAVGATGSVNYLILGFVIGICNGFQTLTRLGLAPALDGRYFEQQAALTHNDSGVFRDDWVTLGANEKSPCVFTKGVDMVRLPLRHGEGKFVADDAVLNEIEARHLAAVKYVNADGSFATEFPANPNGSLRSIAGICDPTGRVFGLMPHPEAFLSPYNSPSWTADKSAGKLAAEGEGVVFFRNAVDYIAEHF